MGLLDESDQAALLKVACSIEVPEQVLIDVRDCSDAVRREATKNLVVRRKKIGRTSDANYALSRTRGAIEFLTELLSDVAPDEKKFFGILEKAFSKEEYALLAAAAGREVETTAQKLRSLMASGSDSGITLFFPADGELESFAVKSMSYTGPTPPPGVTVPKGRKGNATLILSLDLSAFPTLAERAGGETLSLFVESPDTGEFNDDAALVALSKLARRRPPPSARKSRTSGETPAHGTLSGGPRSQADPSGLSGACLWTRLLDSEETRQQRHAAAQRCLYEPWRCGLPLHRRFRHNLAVSLIRSGAPRPDAPALV